MKISSLSIRKTEQGQQLCQRAFLAVSQVSSCSFSPVLWHDWGVACCLTSIWTSLPHLKLMQGSLLSTLADSVPPQGDGKGPGRKLQESALPQFHPSTALSSCEKRAKWAAGLRISCQKDTWDHCFSLACYVTYIKGHYMIVSVKHMVLGWRGNKTKQLNCLFQK